MNELENWPVNINVILPSTDDEKRQKLIELQLIAIIHMQRCIVRNLKDIDGTWFCNRPRCEPLKKLWKHMIFCRDKISCPVPYCTFSKEIVAHWKYCKKEDCPVRLSTEEDCNTGDAMFEKLSEIAKSAMLRVPCELQDVPFTSESILESTKERCLFTTSEFRKQYVQDMLKEIFSTKYFNTLADEQVCDLVDFAKEAEEKMFQKAKCKEEYYQLTTEMKHRIPMEIEKQLEQNLAHQQSHEQQLVSESLQQQNATNESTSEGSIQVGSIQRFINLQQLFLLIDFAEPYKPPTPDFLQSTQITTKPISVNKDWHESVTPELRQHVVQKLIRAVYAKPIERGIMLEPRLKNLVPAMTKTEAHYFEMANSMNEYCHMITCKIFMIEIALEGVREKKKQEALQQAAEQQGPNASAL